MQTSALGLQLVVCDDMQLVMDALAGDRRAFDSLVHRHSSRVFRLALRMLGSREDAEDVQQETFVSAYRGLRKFRQNSSFGTWVYSIAARLCLKKRHRSTRCSEDELALVDLLPAGADSNPEDRLMALESARRVNLTLARLAPADRLLIVFKFIEGMNHDEIADVLGCSVASSRSRLLRAKRLFRDIYESTE